MVFDLAAVVEKVTADQASTEVNRGNVAVNHRVDQSLDLL